MGTYGIGADDGINATCKACGGKCCKILMFTLPPDQDGLQVELIRTRCVGRDGDMIWIGAPCKHLVDGRCSIYDGRPEACRVYEVGSLACESTRANVT